MLALGGVSDYYAKRSASTYAVPTWSAPPPHCCSSVFAVARPNMRSILAAAAAVAAARTTLQQAVRRSSVAELAHCWCTVRSRLSFPEPIRAVGRHRRRERDCHKPATAVRRGGLTAAVAVAVRAAEAVGSGSRRPVDRGQHRTGVLVAAVENTPQSIRGEAVWGIADMRARWSAVADS